MIQTRGIVALLGVCFLAACQNYDFEPVRPIALAQATKAAEVAGTRNTPNLMLVVDKSGSMNAPTDPTDPDCSAACQNGTQLCGAGCPTRWTELQGAMGAFLTDSGQIARMGMMTYPTNRQCSAPTDPRIELVASDAGGDLQARADEIRTILNSIEMAQTGSPQSGDDSHTGGGTPTGNTLAALKRYSALADEGRDNFVLLLTDGLPNCNANNPVDGVSNPTACFCQATSCTGEFSREGCLDATGTIQQVTELFELNVRTIVVGFGIDTNEDKARETLQAMAQAGGFPRACPNSTDAECGTGNTCNQATKECNNKYFSAANGNELAAALATIVQVIDQNICQYTLDVVPQNNSSEFIAVRVDGSTVQEGPQTWRYTGDSKVEIVGELCDRLKAARTSDPISLEIRVIQSL